MKINVYSLKAANNLILSDIKYQKNWISIQDADYSHMYKYIRSACKNVCIVKFDDVTRYHAEKDILHPFLLATKSKRDFIYFNDEHANQIIEFAKEVYNRKEDLNIHCYAGKSRSQAVGYVLNQYFNLYVETNKEDFEFNLKNNSENFLANPEVIKIMNKNLYK